MSTRNEKDRILEAIRLHNGIYQEVDGFYYYQPESNIGILGSYAMRIIADELDRLNAPWEKKIEEEL